MRMHFRLRKERRPGLHERDEMHVHVVCVVGSGEDFDFPLSVVRSYILQKCCFYFVSSRMLL